MRSGRGSLLQPVLTRADVERALEPNEEMLIARVERALAGPQPKPLEIAPVNNQAFIDYVRRQQQTLGVVLPPGLGKSTLLELDYSTLETRILATLFEEHRPMEHYVARGEVTCPECGEEKQKNPFGRQKMEERSLSEILTTLTSTTSSRSSKEAVSKSSSNIYSSGRVGDGLPETSLRTNSSFRSRARLWPRAA